MWGVTSASGGSVIGKVAGGCGNSGGVGSCFVMVWGRAASRLLVAFSRAVEDGAGLKHVYYDVW